MNSLECLVGPTELDVLLAVGGGLAGVDVQSLFFPTLVRVCVIPQVDRASHRTIGDGFDIFDDDDCLN